MSLSDSTQLPVVDFMNLHHEATIFEFSIQVHRAKADMTVVAGERILQFINQRRGIVLQSENLMKMNTVRLWSIVAWSKGCKWLAPAKFKY